MMSHALSITQASMLFFLCIILREVSSQCSDPLIYKLNDIQQLIENCTREIANLNAKHDREIANLNAKYDRDITNLNAKQENCTTAIAKLNAQHDQDIANLNGKLEKQVYYSTYILGLFPPIWSENEPLIKLGQD